MRKQDQRFKRFRTTIFKGLQEKARPFISDNAVIKTEELEKTLKEMQAEGRDLKVGIIGRVKAGKSSLLNALIFEGVEVLPKAATPMTASLTVLKYANTLNAEVEFYSPKDIAELKNEHERYVREFNRIVDEEVKKQKEKQSLSNRAKEGIKNLSNMLNINKSHEAAPKENILSDEEIVKRAERIAKDKLKGDEKLVSSHDQYEKIKKSGLFNTEKLDPRIQANSLQELNQKLLQFVGADGKYMPCTKAVRISLNNPNLKDLEVIDTPGVNDPIASREERTKALLKDCDVVFIVSPSNQFLTDSDMSLFDRVSNKEGLQEIYFVASQADSTVGSMSEVEKSRQHLPTALENAQKSLSSQLKGYADDNNYRLQLDYSLKNLIELKRFKEAMNESYQSDLNDEKLQNDLREWRDLKNTPEEENYREFEEIKKMALYFRDYYMFCLDWYDLSQEKIQEYRDLIDRRNEMLQLDYSLRNLSILKGYKERNEKAYQDYLNDEELQNDLRKWKNGDKPGFFESLFNDLFGK
ncbi:dynamin family protein [Helicobacter pylori]|uniref:dynamin family protein n=1 Tax=Helicobacter pylori TaxID=210 RepID=UPI00281244C3|nr:dynamin family protein [Helicobacter pylori]